MLWIRIRIRMISWIRIRINLQLTSQNVPMEYEPILALFSRFEAFYMEACSNFPRTLLQKSISAGPSLQTEWRDHVCLVQALPCLFSIYRLLTVRFPIWYWSALDISYPFQQCCGSMTFWGGFGSGSADPCLWLMDPDPDRHWPSSCQQRTNFLTQFFLLISFWSYIYIIFQR